MTPDEVLHFWFAGDPSVRRKIWFEKNIAFDSGCNRFADALRRGEDWAGWMTGPRHRMGRLRC